MIFSTCGRGLWRRLIFHLLCKRLQGSTTRIEIFGIFWIFRRWNKLCIVFEELVPLRTLEPWMVSNLVAAAGEFVFSIGSESFARVEAEKLVHQIFRLRGNLQIVIIGPRDSASKNILKHLIGCRCMEWWIPVQELEQNAPDRPPITILVLANTIDSLGRKIIRSTNETTIAIIRVKQRHRRWHHAGLRWCTSHI